MHWGLIGASTIASEHVIGAIRANGHDIVTVLSGDAARGADYAARHGIPESTTDLDALLAPRGSMPSTFRPRTRSTTRRRSPRSRRASTCSAKSRWR